MQGFEAGSHGQGRGQRSQAPHTVLETWNVRQVPFLPQPHPVPVLALNALAIGSSFVAGDYGLDKELKNPFRHAR